MIPADVLATGSGGIVGLVLGMVGGGGSILAVPLLVYVVGVSSPHVAIGTSAVAVSASARATSFPTGAGATLNGGARACSRRLVSLEPWWARSPQRRSTGRSS